MAANVFEALSLEQKLRMSIHRDTRAICREATHLLGLEMDTAAMELIAELAWKKLQVYANDLEHFAKHAKRSTINADDVKLLTRRNSSLKARITALAENQSSSTSKKRKAVVSAAQSCARPSTPLAGAHDGDNFMEFANEFVDLT